MDPFNLKLSDGFLNSVKNLNEALKKPGVTETTVRETASHNAVSTDSANAMY